MLRLLQCLIIYLFAVWTCKISVLACLSAKECNTRATSSSPLSYCLWVKQWVSCSSEKFCVLDQQGLICWCLGYIPAVCSRREEVGRSLHTASGSWMGEEEVATKRREELQGAPKLRGAVCWVSCENVQQGPRVDNELCREQQWDPVGSNAAGAMPKVLSKGSVVSRPAGANLSLPCSWKGKSCLPAHPVLWARCLSQAHTMERAGMLSSRVATNQLQLIAKLHSEITTKSGIYLVRLHATFDSISTLGICAGVFLLSWWHDTFPVWWFVVFLMQQQGRKMAF